jgi:hypothetical protein
MNQAPSWRLIFLHGHRRRASTASIALDTNSGGLFNTPCGFCPPRETARINHDGAVSRHHIK